MPLPSTATTNRWPPGGEVAQDGVGDFAIDGHVLLAGNRVAVAAARGAGVAQQFAENVGQKIGKEFRFIELIGLAGFDQLPPVLQLGPGGLGVGRQDEGGEMRADGVAAEEGTDFGRHSGRTSSGDRACRVYWLAAAVKTGSMGRRASAARAGWSGPENAADRRNAP